MSLSIEKSFARPLLAATVAAALLLAGCGGMGGGEPPPVTDILRVEVKPNPVAAGDTAVFTCIVEDSTDTTLTFKWNLENTFGITDTDTNQYRWEAPSEPKTYSHTVIVERSGDSSVDPVQQPFETKVVKNKN